MTGKQWVSKPDSMGITYGKIGCQYHAAKKAGDDLVGYDCTCTYGQVEAAQVRVLSATYFNEPVTIGDVLLAASRDRYWWRWEHPGTRNGQWISHWTDTAMIARLDGCPSDYTLSRDVVMFRIGGTSLPAPFNVSKYLRNQWAALSSPSAAWGALAGIGIVHFFF